MSAENNFRLIASTWRLNSFRLRLEKDPPKLSPWDDVMKMYTNLTTDEQSKWGEIAYYIGPIETYELVSELMNTHSGRRPEVILVMEEAAQRMKSESTNPTSVES